MEDLRKLSICLCAFFGKFAVHKSDESSKQSHEARYVPEVEQIPCYSPARHPYESKGYPLS